MPDIIVDSPLPITLLGGGHTTPGDIEEALALAPCLVAADGGADLALASGHIPEAVIGDMDSVSDGARTSIPADRLHPVTEQDSTDFDKVLRSVNAPFVLGLGFLGARLDHQLANLSVLVQRSRPVCVLIGGDDVVVALPAGREIALDLPAECRVSLYPLARVGGRSAGLHWPIDGLIFAPDGRVGTSNRVARDWSGPVRLQADGPGLLLILPRVTLPATLCGMRGASD